DMAAGLANTQPAALTCGMSAESAKAATADIPRHSREEMQAAAALPAGQQEAMIDNMINGLEQRLKSNPNDDKGWIMLMRSRMQLGQTAKAKQAMTDGLAAFRNNGAESKRIREAAAALGI